MVYPADYNFWSFLSEFGGVLGLYFGITVITLYETIFFFLSESDVVDKFELKPERCFSREVLYEQESSHDIILALPQ